MFFLKRLGQSDNDGRSRITDAGFNGCSLCSFNRLTKYVGNLEEIRPKTRIVKSRGGEMEFVFRDNESTVSVNSEITHILVGGEFAHSEVRVIGGWAELLLRRWALGGLRLTADFGKRYFFGGW